MAENTATAVPAGNGELPGQPFYEKSRLHLKGLLERKRTLDHNLAMLEEAIYKKETEYLEETPTGNIITGFEAYTKGSGTAPTAARRKGNVLEVNRVFSRSSITYNINAESPMNTSAQNTPVAALAPTPLSSSFQKGDGGSNHATPTSASSANKTGPGNKKGREDGESDVRETKKARTNFGAVRK